MCDLLEPQKCDLLKQVGSTSLNLTVLIIKVLKFTQIEHVIMFIFAGRFMI
jgi:hypothetical protein